ncbi:MAG: sialidase family protein [Lentisphaerota bacterium]
MCGGIVERRDGTLMFAHANHAGLKAGEASVSAYRVSSDAGKTWSTSQPLNCGMGIWGMIRLKSGKLAAYGDKQYGGHNKTTYFSSSSDDGKTWTPPADIGAYQGFCLYLHSLSQLDSGRLLLAGYWEGLNAGRPDEGLHEGATDTIPYTQYGWGIWRGRILFCDGHRGVEMGINIVYYSDDEGLTWKQCTGGIFGWFDERGVPNGEGGIIDVYEPNVAETQDGRLLMIMRSKTGRLLQSYSLDQGETWLSVLPAELSASQTTPMLIKIPSTGDLLCVWNQVSCEEIRRGFQRGRLSAAISRDSGLTWENFKTLELQEGMENTARITPEFPIARRVVGRPGLGQLPDGFAMFSQPNLDVVGDHVFIRYLRMWPVEKTDAKQKPSNQWPSLWPRQEDRGAAWSGNEVVLRVYPLEWFYS